MAHLVVELILWILLAFFAGCILGNLLRRLFTRGEAEALAKPPPVQPVEQVTATVPESVIAEEAQAPVEVKAEAAKES